MGTAITPEQVQLLAAHAEEVVLAMDADAAGREAMLRAQRVAAGKRVRLRVAAMPAGEDPADMLAGKGPGSDAADGFRALVEEADDLPVFHVRMLLAGADLSSPAGRDRALDEVVPVLSAMPESITREELEREVASTLEADPGLVRRRVAGHRPAPRAGAEAGGDRRGRSRPGGGWACVLRQARRRGRSARASGASARCCRWRSRCPSDGVDVLERLTPAHLSSAEMIRARDWLVAHLEAPLHGIPDDDEAFVALVTRLVTDAEREPSSRGAMELNLLWLDRAMVESELAEATADGGDPPVELQKRHGELSEQIASFDSER